MKAILWPNKLGWDVASSEVMQVIHNGSPALKVHTARKVGIVQSTTDPIKAVELVKANGFMRFELDEMDAKDANYIFRGTVL